MSGGVPLDALEALYADTDDPWRFRTSAFEARKFAATRQALPRDRYAAALEIGCGNGELARRLAPLCGAYCGVDAVETALVAARRAVPAGRFHRLLLPARLPGGQYDLIVLSEILYFLDAAGIAALAGEVDARWKRADIVIVTWLGPSGNPLDGAEALAQYRVVSARPFRRVGDDRRYRIDVAGPLG